MQLAHNKTPCDIAYTHYGYPGEQSRSSTTSPLYMALFRTRSAAVFGIDAHLIDVEVDM